MRSWIIPPFDPSEVSRAFHGKDAFVRRERREGGKRERKRKGIPGLMLRSGRADMSITHSTRAENF